MMGGFLCLFRFIDRGVASISHGCSENWCSSFSDNELLALEAIRSLHRIIDDDQDGKIDFDESDEVSFITVLLWSLLVPVLKTKKF